MWALDPAVHHLNHGSFGAVPVPVLEMQTEWRRRAEANPTAFVANDLQPAIDTARLALAKFVGAEAEDLAFVRNASTGVASVLRSIEHRLRPGDELLTTAQDYNAVRQMLEFAAERCDAKVVVAPVPFPVGSPDEVTRAILQSVTEKTRLAVVDHITSPTALVYPLDDLVSRLEPDVPVLVDGAHGPGQVDLTLTALGASWYTGNLHKWVCAPKGAAFLHARADRRADTIPTVVSHGWNAPISEGEDRFQLLFDWLGTDDFSQWLVVPDAIEMVGGFDTLGWDGVRASNHALAIQGRRLIADAVGSELPAPDEMVGTMAAILLPDGSGPAPPGDLSPLMGRLIDDGFETLVMNWPSWPSQLLRISAHLYNELAEYELLAGHLSDLRGSK